MDLIATPRELKRLLGFDDYMLRRHARDGKLRHAQKVGGKWYINATKEWPNLGLERSRDGRKE